MRVTYMLLSGLVSLQVEMILFFSDGRCVLNVEECEVERGRVRWSCCMQWFELLVSDFTVRGNRGSGGGIVLCLVICCLLVVGGRLVVEVDVDCLVTG
jgi:hypothetical protein